MQLDASEVGEPGKRDCTTRSSGENDQKLRFSIHGGHTACRSGSP
jgi:hypothetical protein